MWADAHIACMPKHSFVALLRAAVPGCHWGLGCARLRCEKWDVSAHSPTPLVNGGSLANGGAIENARQ
jgi:hypothetical protein